jgi:hypothetical protein
MRKIAVEVGLVGPGSVLNEKVSTRICHQQHPGLQQHAEVAGASTGRQERNQGPARQSVLSLVAANGTCRCHLQPGASRGNSREYGASTTGKTMA